MRKKNFTWDAYVNLTHYTNKVVMLPDTHKSRMIEGYEGYASGSSFVAEGLPLHTYLMPKYAGVDKSNGLPMWYKDILDADGNILGRTMTSEYSEATEYLCGNPTPDLYGGFGTSLTFWNFDLSASFTYQIGGLSSDSGYAQYMTPPGGTTGANFHVDVLKAWTPENPDSDIPVPGYYENAVPSDFMVYDASFLRLQDLSLGYTFNFKKGFFLKDLTMTLSGNNLLLFKHYNGFDPDVSTESSGSTVRRMDVGAYPKARRVVFSIQIRY